MIGASVKAPRSLSVSRATLALAATVLVAAAACRAPEDAAGTPAAPAEPTRYFPPAEGEWETIAPADVGWSAEGLADALAYAREQRSSGVLVALGGRILAESYWEVLPAEDGSARYENTVAARTEDGRTIEDVASVQKSVVSFLAGVARGKGLLDFDASVQEYLGSGWSEAPAADEAAITVRNLLSMTSGLDIASRFEVPAGQKWMYNTNVYSRLVPVLEAATGLDIATITSRWLTERIGMRESRWGERGWLAPGQDANRIGFQTTARDLARFGLLMAAKGRWQGADVLGDPDYLPEALSPSQSFNEAYGLLWWLNGGTRKMAGTSPEVREGPLVASAPADLYAAQGALGRKLYVVPSLDLVVTRLGDQPEAAFNDELWRRLLSAAPTAASAP